MEKTIDSSVGKEGWVGFWSLVVGLILACEYIEYSVRYDNVMHVFHVSLMLIIAAGVMTLAVVSANDQSATLAALKEHRDVASVIAFVDLLFLFALALQWAFGMYHPLIGWIVGIAMAVFTGSFFVGMTLPINNKQHRIRE
jgi:hypothetical protein